MKIKNEFEFKETRNKRIRKLQSICVFLSVTLESLSREINMLEYELQIAEAKKKIGIQTTQDEEALLRLYGERETEWKK